ncbi:MAG: hypothetical protein PHV23_00415 [Candidatus Gracilibacteria bacterium]|nr:hypothetical protein [Candidatus Gracilibacteria bacterium]
MKEKELYDNYLSKLEEALVQENMENIDFIIETLYTCGISDADMDKIDDILHEATLFLEFNEDDYKETALELISDFKN